MEMLKNIKSVIFDMDGSLIDSMWVWADIDREYLGVRNLNVPPNLQKEIEGMSFEETALYFKKRFNIPDSIEHICRDWNAMARKRYIEDVPLKAGALDFMNTLKAKGIKMGIATSNSRELVDCFLEARGLTGYFLDVKTGGEIKKGKPAPDIYLSVAWDLETNPENCLVFEDIIPGIMAGLNAGMKVCAVYDKYSEYQDEDKRKLAHYYIRDFRDIERVDI